MGFCQAFDKSCSISRNNPGFDAKRLFSYQHWPEGVWRKGGPDLIAFQDDMAHAAEVMQKDAVSQHIEYLILFLRGVARSASDVVLLDATERLGVAHVQQRQLTSELACVAGLVQDRLVERKAV